RPWAIAAPSPREAPVTMATFPSSRKLSSSEAMIKSLADRLDRSGIHVGKFLIFATHAPDKTVGGRADTAVDGPGRRQHDFGIGHHQVTRRLRFAHEMENALRGGHV